jgi:hypothetical protein
MPKPPAELKRRPLAFESAAIFAGDIRPRVELPAPPFEDDEPRPDAREASTTLEVIEGSRETVRDRFLGVANSEHVLLVLPPTDYAALLERVRTIRDNPLRFELTADEYGQLTAAVIDGKAVSLPPHRSGVSGDLDYEIDRGSGGQAAG